MMSNTSGQGQTVAVEIEKMSIQYPRAKGVLGIMESLRWLRLLRASTYGRNIHILRKWKPKFRRPLTGVDLTVYQGEVIGVMAFNGSGKSTLLNTISGIFGVDKGSVRIHGYRAGSEKLRGMVLKTGLGNSLFSEFNAIENCQSIALLYGLDPLVVGRYANEVLSFLGLKENDITAPAERMSSGTKAKVAIARALICLIANSSMAKARGVKIEPVLLLDEPSATLDPIAIEQLSMALKAVRKALPTLTIIIATNNAEDLGICDRVVTIVQRKIETDNADILKRIQDGITQYHATVIWEAKEMLKGKPSKNQVVTVAAPPADFPKWPNAQRVKTNPLSWRSRLEIRQNRLLSFFLVLSLLFMNMFGFLSSKPGWTSIAILALGTWVTLLVRALFRLLEKERGYFSMLDGLLLSPISRRKHLLLDVSNSLKWNTAYAFLTGASMLLLYINKLQRPDLCHLQFESVGVALVCLLSAIPFSTGLGALFCNAPFWMRANNYFFLQMVIPSGAILISGFYHDVNSLPFGFSHLAMINPLTYLAEAIRLKNELPQWDLALKCWICGVIWFIVGYAAYRIGFMISRNAKRMIQG